MRIGEVADQAGVAARLAVIRVAKSAGMALHEIRTLTEHGSAPMSDVLRELSSTKLPELDALIDRAERVRRWLAAARTCECHTIDACALFDEASAAQLTGVQEWCSAPSAPRPAAR